MVVGTPIRMAGTIAHEPQHRTPAPDDETQAFDRGGATLRSSHNRTDATVVAILRLQNGTKWQFLAKASSRLSSQDAIADEYLRCRTFWRRGLANLAMSQSVRAFEMAAAR
jgi:hypothetical protein